MAYQYEKAHQLSWCAFLYKVFYKKFTKFYDNVQKYTIYQK